MLKLHTTSNGQSTSQMEAKDCKEIADALGPQVDDAHQQEIQILPNKKTTLFFQFLYNPEYIGIGNNLIINMENFKAFGTITQLVTEKIQDSHIKGQMR